MENYRFGELEFTNLDEALVEMKRAAKFTVQEDSEMWLQELLGEVAGDAAINAIYEESGCYVNYELKSHETKSGVPAEIRFEFIDHQNYEDIN